MTTKSPQPMFIASLSEDVKQEWIMREYGSYEDSGKSEDHVVSILKRSPKGKVVANNYLEIKFLQKSALFVSDGYDDEGQIKVSRAIARFANKLA